MKIGVFDSGIGGQSVARAIQKSLPQADVIFRSDPEHFPYGSRPMTEVHSFVLTILEKLEREGTDCIVVACNTVSTNLISQLRQELKTPLIAIEPMVKPAALLTKSKIIAVCATPGTLASRRYKELKDTYAQSVQVIEPDCRDWAYLIENNKMNEAKIRQDIEPAIQAGADVIVLGCTHYHWIEQQVKAIAAGRAEVIQPEPAIAARVRQILGLA